ncbi:MAG: tetratricopeptide repeat protein, partial [Ilumatobacteraceae bacterium]
REGESRSRRGDGDGEDRPRRYGAGAGRPSGPRRDGESRRPRGDGDDRRPRREGESRSRRGDGDGEDRPRRYGAGAGRPSGPRRDGDGEDRPRRYGSGAGRPSGPRRDGESRRPRGDGESRRPRGDGESRGFRRGDDDRRGRDVVRGPREPRNEAERRRMAVRAKGGGAARKDLEQTREERVPEQWIDEGPVDALELRNTAEAAAKRAARQAREDGELDPEVKADVAKVLDPKRAARLGERLKDAQNALERERYSEAKRVAKSLMKELSMVAAVHEVVGLASYRLGQYRDAAAALELARSLRERVEDLPVLADCYRALKRWDSVDEIWAILKDASPAHDVMAEGRMVVAGSLADRGDLKGALQLMTKAMEIPRRVREHHLSQWYVIADLYDKAGNVQKAREFFKRVALHDPDFADVADRIKSL